MKKIIYVLIIFVIAFLAFVSGGKYALKNMYIEYLEPEEVEEKYQDGSNFYYAIYSDFFNKPIIYQNIVGRL